MTFTIEARVAPADAERALELLARDGALALELFGDSVILALYNLDAAERVRALLPFASSVTSTFAKTPGTWIGWRDPLRAIQVGPLWIGNERSAPCPVGQYGLVLETKDAFGTGLHETTLLCLQRILELSPVESILDVGTGSGILGLAALALGAKRARATEIDPHALGVAARNAQRNAFADRWTGTIALPEVDETFPLVVANIIAPVLVELAASISSFVAPGGTLILSGLRENEADAVLAVYATFGLERTPASAQRGIWTRHELMRREDLVYGFQPAASAARISSTV